MLGAHSGHRRDASDTLRRHVALLIRASWSVKIAMLALTSTSLSVDSPSSSMRSSRAASSCPSSRQKHQKAISRSESRNPPPCPPKLRHPLTCSIFFLRSLRLLSRSLHVKR